MPKVNLSSFTVKELIELQSDLATAIVERKAAEKAELQKRMSELAEESGFSLTELLENGKQKRGSRPGKSGAAPVKYRNPENPEETWSGRGRMANWLREKISKRGVKIEDFAV